MEETLIPHTLIVSGCSIIEFGKMIFVISLARDDRIISRIMHHQS